MSGIVTRASYARFAPNAGLKLLTLPCRLCGRGVKQYLDQPLVLCRKPCRQTYWGAHTALVRERLADAGYGRRPTVYDGLKPQMEYAHAESLIRAATKPEDVLARLTPDVPATDQMLKRAASIPAMRRREPGGEGQG